MVANRVPAWFAGRAAAIVSRACVAERAGRIVGFAAWTQEALGQLFVAGSEYGSGTAARLLAHGEAALADGKVRTLFLA